MSIRLLGVTPNDYSPKYVWPVEELLCRGAVTVPGFVFEPHTDGTSAETILASSAELILVSADRLPWIGDGCVSALVEWHSNIVLAGTQREFIAHGRRRGSATHSDCPSTALERKRFAEKFLVGVLHAGTTDCESIEERHLTTAGCDRDREAPAEILNIIAAEYRDLYRTLSGTEFPSDIGRQLVAITGRIIQDFNAAQKDSSAWLSVKVRQLFTDVNHDGGAGYVRIHRDIETLQVEAVFAAGHNMRQTLSGTAPVRAVQSEAPFATRLADLATRIPSTSLLVGFVVIGHDVLVDDVYPVASNAARRASDAAKAIASHHPTWRESLSALNAQDVIEVFSPRLSEKDRVTLKPIGRGAGVAPGAGTGVLCIDVEDALACIHRGTPIVFAANSPGPEQIPAVLRASGLLFRTGGMTSHVAVIARGAGIPAVMNTPGLSIETGSNTVLIGQTTVAEGQWLTVDGSGGIVYEGRAELDRGSQFQGSDLEAVLDACDALSTLAVYANADVASDATLAYTLGAKGIGLCRLEHLLVRPDRLAVLQRALVLAFACEQLSDRVVVASRRADRYGAGPGVYAMQHEARLATSSSRTYELYRSTLSELEEAMASDLASLLTVSGERPVTIRLIDAPISEFLTASTVAEHSRVLGLKSAETLGLVAALRDANPMLALRGVRLCLRATEFTSAQIRAILRANAIASDSGASPAIDILIPFVVDPTEVLEIKAIVDNVAQGFRSASQSATRPRVGSMIETPRAALLADRIAKVSDFLSFGTNDLTQFTWACSRDSGESDIFAGTIYSHLGYKPFSSFDHLGVGALMESAIHAARRAAPSISIGVCGEHAVDPQMVGFLARLGATYISCSPLQVPVARLAIGQRTVSSPTVDQIISD